MALDTEKRTEVIVGLRPNRQGNKNGKRVRKRGRQTGLRPAAVETAAFFGDLCRDGYGMKMERQEKDREKQQQSDIATPLRGTGIHVRNSHN